jgi:transcriptional regulator with XRE-family HTH domain
MLGDELKKARQMAGLTQEQVAARARISREYVSQLERNRQFPYGFQRRVSEQYVKRAGFCSVSTLIRWQ